MWRSCGGVPAGLLIGHRDPSRSKEDFMANDLMEPRTITTPSGLAPTPNWNWNRALQAPGHMGVDYETRVDFRRLHEYRLGRARQALKASQCGALLLFDVNNIRYITSTKIGEWERDKLCRFALLAGDGEPILWDFGSAAVHHRLHCDWLKPHNCRAGMLGLRGTVPPAAGLMKRHAEEIRGLLQEAGVADLPLGIDLVEPGMWFELEKAGLKLVDGQQTMLDARMITSPDEIMLLSMAASMVDGVYQMIYEVLKPGIRENDIVALVSKRLYEMGSDDVEGVNAISGERCSPHPHIFSDRLIRPGDQAFFDIIHSYNGYRTCYYRTFNVGRATQSQRDAYTKAREWMDAAIALVKPGVGTDEVVRVWPEAREFGFADEMEAFGLQFGHGLGLALHERPIFSRLNSLQHPVELQEGMVFALETYCPADDGHSAARIEEEIVVTPDGPQLLTLFPAEELVVANRY
jgi:Xaa-Pro aminopeptidase